MLVTLCIPPLPSTVLQFSAVVAVQDLTAHVVHLEATILGDCRKGLLVRQEGHRMYGAEVCLTCHGHEITRSTVEHGCLELVLQQLRSGHLPGLPTTRNEDLSDFSGAVVGRHTYRPEWAIGLVCRYRL